jgi:hypothetical protein
MIPPISVGGAPRQLTPIRLKASIHLPSQIDQAQPPAANEITGFVAGCGTAKRAAREEVYAEVLDPDPRLVVVVSAGR